MSYITIRSHATAADYAYVYVDGRFAGWVRQYGSEWHPYRADGTPVDGDTRTRQGAINEVAAREARRIAEEAP